MYERKNGGIYRSFAIWANAALHLVRPDAKRNVSIDGAIHSSAHFCLGWRGVLRSQLIHSLTMPQNPRATQQRGQHVSRNQRLVVSL